ncbi:MAG: antitoxin Xre/MbcA/ParS toxin-binding domain-containing protein [Gemmatimonadota bacterium]
MTAEVVGWVRDELGFRYVDISAALHASQRTVRRWSEGRVAPRGADRDTIEKLGELKQFLIAVFGTGEAAATWMNLPLPALRGRTPGLAFRAARVAQLIDLLATMESGAFV